MACEDHCNGDRDQLKGKAPKMTREAVSYLTRQTIFSTEKARRELDYQPRVLLEDGMKRTEQSTILFCSPSRMMARRVAIRAMMAPKEKAHLTPTVSQIKPIRRLAGSAAIPMKK